MIESAQLRVVNSMISNMITKKLILMKMMLLPWLIMCLMSMVQMVSVSGLELVMLEEEEYLLLLGLYTISD